MNYSCIRIDENYADSLALWMKFPRLDDQTAWICHRHFHRCPWPRLSKLPEVSCPGRKMANAFVLFFIFLILREKSVVCFVSNYTC